ncbi:hypothetical protein KP509_1Z095500 [Ceratopteris richardii]|nr:hypothetical protein KP509_1Z095500 [Ceratopteris richardii]
MLLSFVILLQMTFSGKHLSCSLLYPTL